MSSSDIDFLDDTPENHDTPVQLDDDAIQEAHLANCKSFHCHYDSINCPKMTRTAKQKMKKLTDLKNAASVFLDFAKKQRVGPNKRKIPPSNNKV